VAILFLCGGGNKKAFSAVFLVAQPQEERGEVPAESDLARFEQALLPHLGAAYNLARWLTRDDHDAEDAVQEAYLRALKFFGGFHGADGRTWLLAIVRNVCYSSLQKKRSHGVAIAFDDETHATGADALNPQTLLVREEDRRSMRKAVEELPPELREVVVLRELEGLSYKEVAAIADIPLGTVMSRLARARDRLQQRLGESTNKET
jgi:RNA polymerase sigma-70 factor (ECF subfamily)